MLWYSVLTIAALLGEAFSFSASHVLHEKRSATLHHKRQRVDGDAIIPIRIGLRQQNLHTGYERLMEVSHPASEKYGQHLSKEEVHSIFAPAEETVEVVKNWLLDSGLFEENDILEYENKGWLAIDMAAKDAEMLFGTEYYEHETEKGEIRIGCDEYSLPIHVSKEVDFIKPGVKLSAPLKKRQLDKWGINNPGKKKPHCPPPHYPGWTLPPGAGKLPPDLQNCGVNITPTCIKALYDIPTILFGGPENAMGVYETYDAFSQEDLTLSLEHFAPWVPADTAPKVLSVDGGTAPVAPGDPRNGGESDIDIFLSLSIVYPQTVTVYQVDDLPNSSGETNLSGFLNTFLDSIDGSYCDYTAFGITGDSPGIDPTYPDTLPGGYTGKLECGAYELTRVVSISYGEAEIDLPKPYVERQCNEIMKLGLQGHSILASSGDYGVASFPGSNGNENGCLSAPGLNGTIYNPDYPSGCPYITSVGATRLYPDQTVDDPESAMQVNLTAFNIQAGSGPVGEPYDFFATSGGFSNYFTPPSYQAADVAAYLKLDLPFQSLPYYEANADATNVGENGGVYNRIGRGWPDVSANGAFLLVYNNLTELTFFGTSLSSPIFGSVITLLNEQRSQAGKGPIGFINPALYESMLLLSYHALTSADLGANQIDDIDPSVLNDITNGSSEFPSNPILL